MVRAAEKRPPHTHRPTGKGLHPSSSLGGHLFFPRLDIRTRGAEPMTNPAPRHRAEYPGILDEARKTTRRLANRATPTHRGAPRNA